MALKEGRRGLIPGIVLTVTSVLMLVVTVNIHWGKDHWNQVIRSDAEGYYAYLPAIFIYQDLNFGFFESIEKYKYHDPYNFYDYRTPVNGVNVNKYYVGTALAQMPFFLMAHGWAKWAGYDMDGYSKPYPLMMSLAAVFWLIIGLVFLNKIFLLYSVRALNRAWLFLACLFGTNLFYYSVGEPGMSHIYSFAFVTLFVYFVAGFFRGKRSWNLVFAALALAMVVLIRPINALVVLSIPFLAGGWNEFIAGFRRIGKNYGVAIVSFLLFLLLIGIQFVIHRLSTGSFFIWSYVNEGFDFSSFHLHDFLVSYKKGFFVYTPLAMIACGGLVFLFKKSKFAGISLLTFLVLLCWVLSSWWNWWYGGSFSSRVMVEYLVFFMLLLAILAEGIQKKAGKILLIAGVVLCVALCQVQTYQYRYHRIHWENMDGQQYWNVFLRIDQL